MILGLVSMVVCSASLDEPQNPSSHSVNQLRCKDLRPGDLLLKFNAGSKTNKMIAFGQSAAGQLNAEVVHAGVMFDQTYIVEASGGGIHASDMRVQNKPFGYLVYRPTSTNVGQGAGTCAKVMFDIHKNRGNLKYSFSGAVGSLFPGGAGGPASRDAMDATLDRILEGRTHRFFCSQFVVYVFQFVAEQNGIPAMSYFAIRDGKVSPSTLASMLQSSGVFKEAGYLMPGER